MSHDADVGPNAPFPALKSYRFRDSFASILDSTFRHELRAFGAQLPKWEYFHDAIEAAPSSLEEVRSGRMNMFLRIGA